MNNLGNDLETKVVGIDGSVMSRIWGPGFLQSFLPTFTKKLA